jgi:hypothetical protein
MKRWKIFLIIDEQNNYVSKEIMRQVDDIW